jgi:hypothetical protein
MITGEPSMGRVVKQVTANTTRYIWYPGDKAEWGRAALAVGLGAVAFAAVGSFSRNLLAAVVCGASVTAAMAGANFGRRDARALVGFPDPGDRAARGAAIVHTGRAVWRALVEGVGAAGIAALVANLPAAGMAANWLLPVVPVTVGTLAHQGGMLYERLGHESAPASVRPAVLPAKELTATK